MPPVRRLVAAALLTGGLALAACGGDDETAPPSASPTPSPTPLNTLNGLEAEGEVVVVKVDNAPSARPLHLGLGTAQVVYQEVVEGGSTRFAAVYVGESDDDIGPVRSARDTDIELFAAYGPVLFAFSGANSAVRQNVDDSPLIAVSQERFASAYEQRGRRAEAYNFYTSTRALLDAAEDEGEGVQDVGFRFGDAAPGGRAVKGRVTVRFSPVSSVTFRYDPKLDGWRLTQDGTPMKMADGATVAPQNIVVQYVDIVRGRYQDSLGNNSPDSRTVGKGRVLVFRDGERFSGRWERPSATDGTSFTTKSGDDLTLRPAGQTWVLLVPKNGEVATS